MSEVMYMPLWDMSLWEPWADQGYLMLSHESNGFVDHGCNFNYSCQGLVANQRSYYGEDHGQRDFAFRCNYDIIEEDALNEKCFIQVLKALIHKADEEILKLEEDILMLDCQLAWDNEELSEPCSVALKKRIDHLDNVIQSFKNEVNYVHDVSAKLEEPGKLTQRLHDLLKPLLENYFLVKSEKTRSSNMVVPTLPFDGTSNKTMETNTSKLSKKVDAKKQVNQRRKDLSVEPEERKNNLPKRRPIAEKEVVKNTEEKKTLSDLKSKGYQRTAENTCTTFSMPVKKAKTAMHKKGEDIISKIFKNAHQYAKMMNKLNEQTGKKVPKSAPTKSEKRSIITSEEPSISIVKQDSNPSRTKKSDSRSGQTGNNEVLSTAEVHRLQFVHEIKTTNSYLKLQEKVGEVVQPSISIVKQDTNPNRTKKSDSGGNDLTGNNEVLSTAEVHRLQFVHEIKTTMSYFKSQKIFGEVVQPSIPKVKQDTNPSRTKKSDSRGSGLMGNKEALSTAAVHQLQFMHEIKTANSYLKPQEKVGEVVQPSIPIVKQYTNPSKAKKSDSRGSGLTRNNEALSSAEVHRLQFVHEIKTTNSYLKSQEQVGEVVQPAYIFYGEQMSEEITETRETRAYRHAINKDLFVKKPLLKKRKRTSFPERADTLETQEPETEEFDDSVSLLELLEKRKRTSFPERADTLETQDPETEEFDDSVSLLELFKLKRKNLRKAMEHTKNQQQGQHAKNLVIKLDNPNYHVKRDQGPGNTYVRKQEIASITCIPEETLQGLSWTEKGDASQVIRTIVSS